MSGGDLKILLLTDAASFHSEKIAQQYEKQNCSVLTLSLEDGQMEYNKLEPVGPIGSLHYTFVVPQITKAIKEFNPDVINAHFVSGYGFTAALANLAFKLPLIINLWGSDVLIVPDKSFLHAWKTAFALRHADLVIGDSKYLVDAAKEMAYLKEDAVIPWGIEQKYFEYHKSDYIIEKPLKIIVPRHHEEVYNNLFIVESLKPLLETNQIEITFPSFGSQVDSFKSACNKLVGDKIKLYPKYERDDFMKFMSRFDLYLSASKSDSSPVSLIEAMALGLIPVAAEIEGVKEWLNRDCGFLFEQNNHKSLYNTIKHILESDKSFESIRQSNFERVKRAAIFENNIALQIKLMKESVERKRRG